MPGDPKQLQLPWFLRFGRMIRPLGDTWFTWRANKDFQGILLAAFIRHRQVNSHPRLVGWRWQLITSIGMVLILLLPAELFGTHTRRDLLCKAILLILWWMVCDEGIYRLRRKHFLAQYKWACPCGYFLRGRGKQKTCPECGQTKPPNTPAVPSPV